MPASPATVDEVLVAGSLAGVPVTQAQAEAIVATIAHFESPETACLGLKSWNVADPEIAFAPQVDDSFVEVHFHYLPEDSAQLESAPLGLEVTLFNTDGTVRSSQDFG